MKEKLRKVSKIIFACYIFVVAPLILYPFSVFFIVCLSLLSVLVFANPLDIYEWLYDEMDLEDLIKIKNYKALFEEAFK